MRFLTPGAPLLLLCLALYTTGQAQPAPDDALATRFEGKYGQVEVGGPYVGAEFHNSRPLPSRLSFYYPVANSIDLSTDYWKRDASQPLTVTLAIDGREEAVGAEAFIYEWTPYRAVFEQKRPGYEAMISYRFAEDLPLMVLQITVSNTSDTRRTFHLTTHLRTSLRTSHAFTVKDSARVRTLHQGRLFLAAFDDVETDSALVFVADAGTPALPPDEEPRTNALLIAKPEAVFRYEKSLGPGDELVVLQLIGSCRQQEAEALIQRALATWEKSVMRYEGRVTGYVEEQARFALPDLALTHTARWSKALLQANRHVIDGHLAPMPAPAEYNFFFTHDLLLTDLGAVLFDPARVRDDLRYLHALARPDSVLPHAYYWRGDGFQTEFAGSDNWNHLWFLILTASYLRHSDDLETVALLGPMLEKSLRLMLENEQDGLMYGERPDWWDVGHVYGARAYLTTLMIRALQSYTFLALKLGKEEASLRGYDELAGRMKQRLVERLWDAEAGYLLNMLDATTPDRHYYSGSLLAAAFDVLDDEKKQALLATARRELLDPRLGIRNAMPPDFHELIDVYHFSGMEAGAPYVYMNGGVWPQGIAWYALALLAADRPDEARETLTKYLTLAGIRDSPNGQPSFFEYRNAAPGTPGYGQIDKPTFLWAGGWYLLVLYRLAGLRENAWNVSFSPHLPQGFGGVAYDLTFRGVRSRVTWTGEGAFFQQIIVDGKSVPSAVLMAPATRIALARGLPTQPYLAAADCLVERVDYEEQGRGLAVTVMGVVGQEIILEIAAPRAFRLSGVRASGQDVQRAARSVEKEGAQVVTLRTALVATEATFLFRF